MSTRATVHFCDPSEETQAIVYRHSDGYPSELGEDLKTFLNEVKDNVPDNRFDDPSYLAAKFVVWQAKRYANFTISGQPNYLNFLSVGVLMADPSDIEYRYKIICKDSNLPEIKIESV